MHPFPCSIPASISRRLRRVFAQERPKIALLTPNFQNPTGTTIPLSAREAILRLAVEFQVQIIENDIYGALRYTGDQPADLKATWRRRAVPQLLEGGISRSASRLDHRAEADDCRSDRSPAMVRPAHGSVVAGGACCVSRNRAGLPNMASERGHLAATGWQAALTALEKYMPPGTSFTRPEGGMSIWVRLPEPARRD